MKNSARCELFFKKDKEIVLAAVKNVPAAVRFLADYTLLDDIDIALSVR